MEKNWLLEQKIENDGGCGRVQTWTKDAPVQHYLNWLDVDMLRTCSILALYINIL